MRVRHEFTVSRQQYVQMGRAAFNRFYKIIRWHLNVDAVDVRLKSRPR